VTRVSCKPLLSSTCSASSSAVAFPGHDTSRGVRDPLWFSRACQRRSPRCPVRLAALARGRDFGRDALPRRNGADAVASFGLSDRYDFGESDSTPGMKSAQASLVRQDASLRAALTVCDSCTASRRLTPRTAITRSIGLPLSAQRMQRASLVRPFLRRVEGRAAREHREIGHGWATDSRRTRERRCLPAEL